MVGLDAGPWQSTIQKQASGCSICDPGCREFPKVNDHPERIWYKRHHHSTRHPGLVRTGQQTSPHLVLGQTLPQARLPSSYQPGHQLRLCKGAFSFSYRFFTFSIWVVQPSSLVETYCTEQAFSRIAEPFSLLKQIIFWDTQDLNSYHKNEHDNKHCYICALVR